MHDVPRLVKEAVRDVRAKPDAFEQTMRRVRSRQRSRRVAAGTTALMLAVGGTWLVWRSFTGPPKTAPAAPEGGRIVFTTQRPGDLMPLIAVMDGDGSGLHTLAPGNDPEWSSDGTMIAFSRPGADRSAEIYVMNADGTNVRQITDNTEGIFDEEPSWSPDGRRLVFSRSVLDLSDPDPLPTKSYRDLYSVAVDGTGLTKLLGGSTDDFAPDWSPDGSLIAFVRIVDPTSQGTQQIWTVHADGSDVRRITRIADSAGEPDWSPDGSALAFDDGENIAIIDADGEGSRTLDLPSAWGEVAAFPNSPTWSPEGSQIAFAAGPDDNHDIFVVDVSGTNLERLTGPDGQDNEPSWVQPSSQ